MKSLLAAAIVLTLGLSAGAQAHPRQSNKQSQGPVSLTFKGSDYSALYLYLWLRYATQTTSEDSRGYDIQGENFSIKAYSSDDDEMSLEHAVTLDFDGVTNRMYVENNKIVFEGQLAFLLTQGAAIDSAMHGGIKITNGVYFGDFKVEPRYSTLMCERVTLPIEGSHLVQQISRCMVDSSLGK